MTIIYITAAVAVSAIAYYNREKIIKTVKTRGAGGKLPPKKKN